MVIAALRSFINSRIAYIRIARSVTLKSLARALADDKLASMRRDGLKAIATLPPEFIGCARSFAKASKASRVGSSPSRRR
jgi:hypothetical protein